MVLNLLEGIGPVRVRQLLECFGDAAKAALADGDLCLASYELLSDLVAASKGWSLRDHVDRIKAELEEG